MEMKGATSTPSHGWAPTAAGVSADLADARSRLRAAAPAGSWDAVLAEVRKVQDERSLTLLAALQVVYAKLASGWVPLRG